MSKQIPFEMVLEKAYQYKAEMSQFLRDMIAIPTQVHGLDPRVNPDPLAIDPTRKRARHSTFGSGPHMCPGQELARKEVAITLEEWLKRIPDFALSQGSDLSPVPGIVGALRRVELVWES